MILVRMDPWIFKTLASGFNTELSHLLVLSRHHQPEGSEFGEKMAYDSPTRETPHLKACTLSGSKHCRPELSKPRRRNRFRFRLGDLGHQLKAERNEVPGLDKRQAL